MLIVLAVVAAATFILTLVDGVRDAAMAQIGSDVVLGTYILLLVGTNHAGRRRRSARSLRRLRTPPTDRAGRSAAPGWAPASGWQPDGGWEPDGAWECDGGTAGGRDPVGGWDPDPEADDTAGFEAVTLRSAVGR